MENNSDELTDLEIIDIFSDLGVVDEPDEKKTPVVKKITVGKIVLMVFIGLIISGLIFGGVYGLYTRYIRFPDEH